MSILSRRIGKRITNDLADAFWQLSRAASRCISSFSVMTPGQFTLEPVQRAAIRATRLAQLVHRDIYLGMAIPQACTRRRAVQRQFCSGDFNVVLRSVYGLHNQPP